MPLTTEDLKAIHSIVKEAVETSKGRFNEKTMDTKVASQIYGIPKRKLNTLCLLGKIKAIKPHGSSKWLIKPADMQRYVDGFPADTEQERKRQVQEKRRKAKHLSLNQHF